MYKIIDNALKSYSELEKYSLKCEFRDVVDPIDDVVYPLICEEIPRGITEEIESLIGVKPNYLFMRMSPKGVPCPHPVHHDLSMGKKSLMLYMFSVPGSGTGFVAHKAMGTMVAPEREEMVEILKRDVGDMDKWRLVDHVQAKRNRAVIFPAEIMHCALPIGGFGDSQSTSRIVLTAFYD